MALNIPMPSANFGGQVSQNSQNLFNELMNKQMREKQLAQQAKQHADSLEIQRQQQARLNQLAPIQQQLMTAKMQKAIADAKKAEMWTQLLSRQPSADQMGQIGNQAEQKVDNNDIGQSFIPSISNDYQQETAPPDQSTLINALQAMNNPGKTQNVSPGKIGDEQEVIVKPGNPQFAHLDRLAGIAGIPNVQMHYEDGNLITRYPSGKTTMTRVSPSSVDQARSKEFAKNDSKIASEMTGLLPGGITLQRNYQRVNELFNSPLWKQMQNNMLAQYGTDYGRKASLAAYKNIGTPQEKEMIGKVQALTNQIVANSASLFKGPFRISEQGLIERMKPTETDPVDVALGKLSELQNLAQFQNYINSRVPSLIREQKMSPQQAFQQALEESNAEPFAESMEMKYGSTPKGIQSEKQTITIRNKKTGVTETVTVEEARKRGVPNV